MYGHIVYVPTESLEDPEFFWKDLPRHWRMGVRIPQTLDLLDGLVKLFLQSGKLSRIALLCSTNRSRCLGTLASRGGTVWGEKCGLEIEKSHV